ncbi:MAG TPA: metallopeptidase TldD-related protein [Streptosporangiaceae bacterium]|jgi:predicted Zn-dependent protease
MTRPGPQEDVERALQAARGGDCVVIAEESSAANLRWAGNTLTTNGVSRARRLTVIALRGGPGGTSTGIVSRTGVPSGEIPALVAEAERAATSAPPAPDAQPLAGAGQAGPRAAGPGWDDPAASTGPAVFSAFASELGDAFDAAGAAGRRLYGFAEHSMTSVFLGNSAGLRLRHDQPSGKAELNAKSADLSRSAWAGAATRDFADVAVADLHARLATELDWAARKVALPPGRYETLLSPSAVADLYIFLYWAAGAKDALDGRTVFSRPGGGTRVGEQLTSVPLTLRGDPGAAGLQCAPFMIAHSSDREMSVFDNGLALHPTEWISGGRLSALVQTRYSAGLSGLAVTPAVDNLIMEVPGGSQSVAGLVAGTRRGLLVSCLWYIREVDPQTLLLTGLTRDGVYLVENGEVTGAVHNFRFNESPVKMLARITGAGASVPALPRECSDDFVRAAMPPLRIDGFNMSSVSQAS